jgi:mannitol-1-phosphate 5-dehydrogenase
MSKPKALHFGAGNIGRGFIGPLYVESGYCVVFTDVIKSIIDELNKRDSYNVHILDNQERIQTVTSVSGVLSLGEDVIREIADPNVRIISTAVGPNVLPRIAPTIAKGLHARRETGAGPLNVIACENMVGGTAQLHGYVSQHLAAEDKPWVEQHIGFANCSVDRIVPPAKPDDNPLDVVVEGFYEWVVDESAFKSPIEPKVGGMQLTQNLNLYIERKLFTLNCGHAITAYLGSVMQYQKIDQAIKDPQIRTIVRGALQEGGAALVKKHNFDLAEHSKYVEKILTRFENAKLNDEVVRVGREPLRKLGKADRLLGPTNMALGYGLPVDNLLRGVAAAFLYNVPEDGQSVELQEKVKKVGISKAVEEVAGFKEGSEEHGKILQAIDDLSKKAKC